MSNFYMLMGSALFCDGSCQDEHIDQSGFFEDRQQSQDCGGGKTNIHGHVLDCTACSTGTKKLCTKHTDQTYDEVRLVCKSDCPTGWDLIGQLKRNNPSERGASSCSSNAQSGGDIFLESQGIWFYAFCNGGSGGECTGGDTNICAHPFSPNPGPQPGPQPGPSPPFFPTPQPLTPPGGSGNGGSQTFWQKYKWWIIVGGVVLLLVLVVIIIFASLKKKKSQN